MFEESYVGLTVSDMPLLFGSMLSTVHQRVIIGIKVQLLSVPSYAMRILLFVMPGVPLVFADVRTFHPFIWIGDTESLLDIEDGYCRFRVAPSVMVWDEVHKGNPCVGIVDKAAFRKGEAAIMIARKADNTEGFVSFHRNIDNLLQHVTVRCARLRDREVL